MIRKRRRKDGSTGYCVWGLNDIESKTFNSRAEAKRYVKEQLKLRSTRKNFPYDFREKLTVSDAIDQFIDECFDPTQSAYRSRVSQLKWWSCQIGHYTLAQMDSSGRPIISMHRNILKKGKDIPIHKRKERCNSTVNCYISAISTVFTFAVDDKEWIRNNPALRFHLNTGNGRTRFLSPSEQKILLESTQESSNRHLYLIVLLALSTGGRKNEIRCLKWSNVLLDKKKIILDKTKNGDIGVLPLSGKPLEELEKSYLTRCIHSEFVFPRKHDVSKPTTIRSAWAAALKRTDIYDFHFHDLRHTFASNLAAAGATLYELKAALRHRSISMVAKYAHLTDHHTAKITRKVNRKLFK